jgi:glycosyltransferase involved in cell wall biosynthesis
VSLAQGEFIARMDADDVAHPERLEKQLAVMQAYPDLDLLGTNVRWIDQNDNVIGYPRVITEPVDLRWNIFFRNCFNHPTVMIRKSSLKRNQLNYGVIPEAIANYFPEQISGIGDEDYLLFGLLSLNGKVGNLDEVLLDYRIHGKSLTASFSEEQNEQTQRIASALRTIYTLHSYDQGAATNDLKSLNPGLDSSFGQQQIEAIMKNMLRDFKNPVDRRRIKIQYLLQRAILAQNKQSFLWRTFVGLGIIFKFAALRWSDLPILLRYIFGPKSTAFYKKFSPLRSG